MPTDLHPCAAARPEEGIDVLALAVWLCLGGATVSAWLAMVFFFIPLLASRLFS